MENTPVDVTASPERKTFGGGESVKTIRYLSQEDILACGILDLSAPIEIVEKAFCLLEAGDCVQPDKTVLRWGETQEDEYARGRINFLSAYVGGDVDALGMKWIASFPKNKVNENLPRASGLILLNDPMTGLPVAMLDAAIISAVRTGAVSGIGAKYLARHDSQKVGIIGSGVQARTQLLAFKAVLSELREVTVFDKDEETAKYFSVEMEERLGIPVKVVSDPEFALRNTDIALVATTAHRPLMKESWVSPGMLTIQFAGHECEYGVIQHADKLVCDHWGAAKHRGISTPAIMHQEGLLSDDRIHASLSQLVTGKKVGRESNEEHIHFFSIGLGITDVAVASWVMSKAISLGLGRELKLWDRPYWV